jgi:hypothetical protein
VVGGDDHAQLHGWAIPHKGATKRHPRNWKDRRWLKLEGCQRKWLGANVSRL